MIKLFWNTHNQKKPNSNNNKVREKEELDYGWGQYHKKSSDKWIYEILKKIKYNIIHSKEELEQEDILIIVDSSVEEKNKIYTELSLVCSKIFLFHLGDEFGFHNLSTVYNICDYVWRPFCATKYFNNPKVKCIPIGYKSGVSYKKGSESKYKWAFTGTPHKSSRHDLLFQFSNIKPFFSHKTEKFDRKNISVDQMNEVLSVTEFIPCPYGFFHPETYRVFEALECRCIPIVESAYDYYDRVFPDNPFIKINMWKDAKPILEGWDKDQIKKKSEECFSWWIKKKSDLQNSIRDKINL